MNINGSEKDGSESPSPEKPWVVGIISNVEVTAISPEDVLIRDTRFPEDRGIPVHVSHLRALAAILRAAKDDCRAMLDY